MARSYILTAVLSRDVDDGGYIAQVAELPGAISQGNTIEQAIRNVREAAELYLEDATEDELRRLGG